MSDDNPSGMVALVAAAGDGLRLGQGPKAFLQIEGKSLLQHVVTLLHGHVGRILVGVSADFVDRAKAEVGNNAEVYPGGSTRLATISNLLARSSEPLIVILDAARPFTSPEVLTQVIAAGRRYGAAGACRNFGMPVAEIEDSFVKTISSKSKGVLFQTPLVCRRETLELALGYAREKGIEDEGLSELLFRSGTRLRAVPDTESNIKITTPLDLEIAIKVIAPSLRGA